MCMFDCNLITAAIYFVINIVEQPFQVKLLGQNFNKIPVVSENPYTLKTCLEMFSLLVFDRYLSNNI